MDQGSVTFHTYILQCVDGSYYVGIADDVVRRVQRHNDGRGANWTAKRRPVTLVYFETFPSLQRAEARERQLKGWSRAKKQALISAASGKLKLLSRCRASTADWRAVA